MRLKDKTALITGAGSGIGAAIAQRFVEDGAKVCIVGRRQELLEKVAGDLAPGLVKICPGDVAKADDIAKMVKTAADFGGQVDILVNCAGINHPGGVTSIDLKDWDNILAINLTGPFLLMRAVIPMMIKNGGGSIINIASIGGLRCLSDRVGYCTSKAALIMLTQQAARDFGKDKVRCNVVCPGFVYTPMTEGHFGEFGQVDSSKFRAVPMGRGALPGEMGGICSFLASDDSSYMTGSVLVVDGGTTIVDPFEIGLDG